MHCAICQPSYSSVSSSSLFNPLDNSFLNHFIRRNAPRSVAPGPRRSGGSGSRGDATTRLYTGRLHPATGSHLPSEDTAPPCAVALRLLGPTACWLPLPERERAGERAKKTMRCIDMIVRLRHARPRLWPLMQRFEAPAMLLPPIRNRILKMTRLESGKAQGGAWLFICNDE